MNNRNARRNRTLLLLTLSAAIMGTANAGALQVGQVGMVPNSAGNGAFTFNIVNNGASAANHVRVYMGGADTLACAGTTAGGRAFALSGSLGAGDSVQCAAGSVKAPVGRHTTSITVVGYGAHGVPLQVTAHATYATAAVPPQSIIGLVSGAVFNDTNTDRDFDTGETIDYNYTVYNIGNTPLSNIVVTDSFVAAVSCPATTLAVGAAMTCTGTHTITASEASLPTIASLQSSPEVNATGPGGATASSPDSVTRLQSNAPLIKATKSPVFDQDKDFNNIAGPGDVVRYVFALKNSANQTLNQVDMTEADPTNIDGTISCNTTTVEGNPFSGLGTGTLVPGDAVLCSAVHTITAAETTSGQAKNLVNISGNGSFGSSATGSAASQFTVLPPPPPVTAVPAPVNDWRAMLLLGLGLLAAGFAVTRRKRRG